jgi:cytochrome c
MTHPAAIAAGFALAMGTALTGYAQGDASRGAQVARACMACHSFQPGRHMTGPSLAGVLGRKAGAAEGFSRYSDALQRSGIVWDEKHLATWLTNPQAMVPGTTMAFPGLRGATVRADMIAYLEAISSGKMKAAERGLPDLKKANAAARVTAITHCGDAYRVTTADGKTQAFWEFNLRFKTDGSTQGPAPGKPVIVGSGMQGDRAAVVFSRIEELSPFVRALCP